MKFAILLALSFALVGCSGSEPPPATPAGDPAAAMPTVPQRPVYSEAFVNHMHAHADRIDEINYALDDGNLEAALTPAYWLMAHDEIPGVPAEWQTYVDGMQDEAAEIELAANVDEAKAAAARLVEQCQGCHRAAGVAALN